MRIHHENTLQITRIHHKSREDITHHENTQQITRIHPKSREYITRIHFKSREYITRIHHTSREYTANHENTSQITRIHHTHENKSREYTSNHENTPQITRNITHHENTHKSRYTPNHENTSREYTSNHENTSREYTTHHENTPQIMRIHHKSPEYTTIMRIHSTFNTIVPIKLAVKLSDLGLNSSPCDWIQDFLTARPQVVKWANSPPTLSPLIEAPQGCVLSPLLYSLYTHDCVSSHSSASLVKFSDDTVVLGLITNMMRPILG